VDKVRGADRKYVIIPAGSLISRSSRSQRHRERAEATRAVLRLDVCFQWEGANSRSNLVPFDYARGFSQGSAESAECSPCRTEGTDNVWVWPRPELPDLPAATCCLHLLLHDVLTPVCVFSSMLSGVRLHIEFLIHNLYMRLANRVREVRSIH
jgi:hypothetical protein